jgi:glycosyltransferase involved in cell wall biosynthesis
MSTGPIPRRILMTTDTVGGVFDYAVELSTVLGRRGIEVLLATMGAPLSNAQKQTLATIESLKIFESRFKLEWMDDPWRDVDQAGEWLLEIENSTRPDLVHLNGYAHGALPWRAPCLVVGHSCVLSWWRAVLGEAAPDRLREYERRVRRGLRHAALVVAPSTAMLRSLRDHYADFEKSRVIYNARSPRKFRPAFKEPFVFSMGRLWDEAKNIELVDRAAAGLPWRVLVAGSVEQPEAGGNRAPTRLTHAEALGSLDSKAVADILARASVYVHPARYEPFGLAILEAALAGCALVLGDIPSLREIWQDAAVFVPPDDATRLNHELTRLIRDGAGRHALGERARRAARHYSPARMGSEYIAAYRQILNVPRVYQSQEKSVCA